MDNDYGQATFEGFKSAIDQFGIKVFGEYTYSLKDRQFGSIVASVKRDNPDVIYITGYFLHCRPLGEPASLGRYPRADHRIAGSPPTIYTPSTAGPAIWMSFSASNENATAKGLRSVNPSGP
jgi:hypothetical protein